jgi:hypothetical protein
MHCSAREVVGAFPSAGALETAIEQLEIEGVNRAAISVLSVDAARTGRVDARGRAKSPSPWAGGGRRPSHVRRLALRYDKAATWSELLSIACRQVYLQRAIDLRSPRHPLPNEA